MNHSAAVLEIEDLHVVIRSAGRTSHILRGVNLTVPAAGVHALVGESGGGKTMVTRAATGLLPRGARIVRGRIRLAGQDVTRWSEAQWRRVRGPVVSMVLQDPLSALNPVRRIGAQIADVLRLHRGLGGSDLAGALLALLERVHLRDPQRVLGQYPHELSGGMRQRVVIAMAWACRPQLILCDEPTTALDATVQKEVLRLIHELARDGQGVLLVTHDLGVVAKLARSMSVIHSGRILEAGPVAEVYAQPRHAYTRALLAATPRFDRPGQTLQPVDDALIARLEAEALALDGAQDAR
ncbi:ABC transporter ATP-binding protein [Verminephrobacter eiseniae]|uniref:ABC transporter ATP-binding protein n=1 Tax=Verminephrobacter eiseniae TaxID=364317 RepID=UPI0022370A2A|nr:ABC transporter ATP-binding protein [Verminephrobacter eiseniae]MCW5262918.1 ABC transporter ATP-binding protein [Verminephrobacter eiseniae]